MDVASQAGLTAVIHGGGDRKDHLLESVGTGAAFLDYDEDGRLDVFLVNAWALDEEPARVRVKGRNVLYRNRGDGTFEDVTTRAGVWDESWGCGVCAGDYDRDGHVDLFVTNFGPDRLYRNRGDGTFEQTAEKAGVADPAWGAGCSLFDADGDGDLDLYVANYVEATLEDVLSARRTNLWREKVKVMVGPFGLRGGRDHFYRNRGNGTFEDATDQAGMTDTAESYGLGVLASDLDQDGDVDVFVANDSNPNFLYRNDGKGKFTEIGTWSGAGLNGQGIAQAGMGVDAGDLDGDGLEDIVLSTFIHDSSSLYRNLGSLQFEDVSTRLGLKTITYEVLKWGCAFFDYDLDGDLDLVIVNGHIYPQVDQVRRAARDLSAVADPLAERSREAHRSVTAGGTGIPGSGLGSRSGRRRLRRRRRPGSPDHGHGRPAAAAPQRLATPGPLAEAASPEPAGRPRDQRTGRALRRGQVAAAGAPQRFHLPVPERPRAPLRHGHGDDGRHRGNPLAGRAEIHHQECRRPTRP